LTSARPFRVTISITSSFFCFSIASRNFSLSEPFCAAAPPARAPISSAAMAIRVRIVFMLVSIGRAPRPAVPDLP
jgi:hypothetical protein